jgi:transcriptional regulator with XRE-family HTH domain
MFCVNYILNILFLIDAWFSCYTLIMMNKMFQNRLKELRKARKLSQEDLGKVINISGRNISYLEAGERSPSPEILNKLADVFDVSVDYLLGRSGLRQADAEQILSLFKDLPQEAVNEMKDYLSYIRQKYRVK